MIKIIIFKKVLLKKLEPNNLTEPTKLVQFSFGSYSLFLQFDFVKIGKNQIDRYSPLVSFLYCCLSILLSGCVRLKEQVNFHPFMSAYIFAPCCLIYFSDLKFIWFFC